MRSGNVEQIKDNMHNELRTRYREFFESQLAIHLLKHAEYFPSVKKMSAAIVKLMTVNKNVVMKVIGENPKITEELREPYFGSLFSHEEIVSAETVYDKMIAALNAVNPNLSSVMQVHCIFVYRLHDHLEQKRDKSEFVSTLFPSSFFNRECRSRVEKKGEVTATSLLGITNHPVFTKMLEQHDKLHVRALDKFTPDNNAAFSKSAIEKSIPLVCGPSGHTGSLMLGTKLYGELTTDELKEYALACFAFLTAGGNHSFHEVYVIANLLGVAYQTDNYSTSVPDSIIAAKSYEDIRKRFPEF